MCSCVWEKYKKNKSWKISTWSKRVSYQVIKNEGNVSDIMNLPAATKKNMRRKNIVAGANTLSLLATTASSQERQLEPSSTPTSPSLLLTVVGPVQGPPVDAPIDASAPSSKRPSLQPKKGCPVASSSARALSSTSSKETSPSLPLTVVGPV